MRSVLACVLSNHLDVRRRRKRMKGKRNLKRDDVFVVRLCANEANINKWYNQPNEAWIPAASG